tara:strand:- start:160 stop:324 length:165 start_codon:yes stop_codon:yes gene_type:complete
MSATARSDILAILNDMELLVDRIQNNEHYSDSDLFTEPLKEMIEGIRHLMETEL